MSLASLPPRFGSSPQPVLWCIHLLFSFHLPSSPSTFLSSPSTSSLLYSPPLFFIHLLPSLSTSSLLLPPPLFSIRILSSSTLITSTCGSNTHCGAWTHISSAFSLPFSSRHYWDSSACPYREVSLIEGYFCAVVETAGRALNKRGVMYSGCPALYWETGALFHSSWQFTGWGDLWAMVEEVK